MLKSVFTDFCAKIFKITVDIEKNVKCLVFLTTCRVYEINVFYILVSRLYMEQDLVKLNLNSQH